MNFTVYKYDDIVILLNDLLEFKKQSNSMFSLRAWAKVLGYTYPSYLSQCLRRERKINTDFMRRLFETSDFDKGEKEYLSFLYLLHSAQDIDGLEIEMMRSVFCANCEQLGN